MTALTINKKPLPAAVEGGRIALSPEARKKIRALMGARPVPFLGQLVFAWAVIIGSLSDVWAAWSSLARSDVPITKQATLGDDAAISSARRIPWAVSIMAQSGRFEGAPASSRTAKA